MPQKTWNIQTWQFCENVTFSGWWVYVTLLKVGQVTSNDRGAKRSRRLNHLECKIGFLQLRLRTSLAKATCAPCPGFMVLSWLVGQKFQLVGNIQVAIETWLLKVIKFVNRKANEKPMIWAMAAKPFYVQIQILTVEIPSRQTSPYPTKRHNRKIMSSSNFVPFKKGTVIY